MENNDPIKITSVIVTFVICLAGAVLSFWIYTYIIQRSPVTSEPDKSKIEVDNKKLQTVQATGKPTVQMPADGFGRDNPYLPYK